MSDPAAAPAAEPTGDPAAAPAVEPTPTPGEGDWRNSLPEDMRNNATLQEVKSVEVLAKRFLDTKSMVGNSIRVPGADAPAEDIAAFRQSLLEKNVGLMAVPNTEDAESMAAVHKAMGLPDDAAGYVKPEHWVGMTDERFGFLAGEAHKAGLSKSQFEQMAGSMAVADNDRMSGFDADHKSGIDQLKGDWGRAYDQKVSRASNIAKQLDAPEGLQAALADGKVDAGTLRWLDSIAEKFGNESNSFVKDPSNVSEHTPTELKERIAEVTKKMLDMDPLDPLYQGLLTKRVEYAKLLSGES